MAATRTPTIIGVSAFMMALSLISVILRFVARKMMRQGLWWDDLLILAGAVFAYVFCLDVLAYMVPRGLGHHIATEDIDAPIVWAKGVFYGELAYFLSLASVKYSILCFYLRVFSTDRIRLPVYIIFAVVTSWLIAVFLVGIFLCYPVSAFWERFSDPSLQLSCTHVDTRKYFIGNSVPNVLTDAALILLPLPFVWTLNLPRWKKIALSNVFIFGLLIVIISIVRFVFLVELDLSAPDLTWNFVDTCLMSVVELNIAVVCGNLPSLRPLLTLLMKDHPHIEEHEPCQDPEKRRAPRTRAAFWSKAGTVTRIEHGDQCPRSTNTESTRSRALDLKSTPASTATASTQ